MKIFASIALVALLALPSQAQSSALSMSWDATTGEVTTTLSATTSDSLTILAAGANLATNVLGGGLVTLGIDQPMFFDVGRSDPTGNLTLVSNVPNPPLGMSIHFQAVTVDFFGYLKSLYSGAGGGTTGGGTPGSGGSGWSGWNRPTPPAPTAMGGGTSHLGFITFTVSNVHSVMF